MTDTGSSAERWLPVPGWEGLYEVSDLGRVKSLGRWYVRRSDGARRWHHERVLTPSADNMGYPRVCLYAGGKETRYHVRVHALLMAAFVGPRPQGLDVCHRDGDKRNNVLSNLRYDTRSENKRDDACNGVFCGQKVCWAILTEDDVRELRDRKERSPGTSYTMLAREFGVSPAAVYKAVTRKTWRCVA